MRSLGSHRSRLGTGLAFLLSTGCAVEVTEEAETTGAEYEVAAPDPCAALLTYDACQEAPEDWYCNWWLTRTVVQSCGGVPADVGCYSLFSQCGERVTCREGGDCERRCAEGQTCTSFVNSGCYRGSAASNYCSHGPCSHETFSLCIPATLPGSEGP